MRVLFFKNTTNHLNGEHQLSRAEPFSPWRALTPPSAPPPVAPIETTRKEWRGRESFERIMYQSSLGRERNPPPLLFSFGLDCYQPKKH